MRRQLEKLQVMTALRVLLLVMAGHVSVTHAQQEESGSLEGGQDEATEERRQRPMVSTGLGNQALARQHPEAAIWLEPEDHGRQLVLFEPESRSPAKGAVLILADEGQSAASGLAGAMRSPLGAQGWAVMTVGLEVPPYPVIRDRDENSVTSAQDRATEPAEDSNKDVGSVMIDVIDEDTPGDAAEQYRERIQATLETALQELRKRDYQRLVLVGVGQGAEHVTLKAVDSGVIAGLVWIAPEFTILDKQSLPEALSGKGSWPLLELYSSRTNSQASSQREAALARAGIRGYQRQPVAIAQTPAPREALSLVNRLVAWLDRNQ